MWWATIRVSRGLSERDSKRVAIIGTMKGSNIQYFVHDLTDAAVKRRVEMLSLAGADVSVVGFVRDPARIPAFASMTVLGQTHNARFFQRIRAVIAQSIRLLVQRTSIRPADVLIARNLEMLLLAHVVRLRSPVKIPVIYECLDVHRLMLGRGLPAVLLRHVERILMKASSGLITSSPAYVTEYFHAIARVDPRVILIENRVFGLPALPCPLPLVSGPPWTIAWNGAIRCSKSLDILRRVTELGNGSIRVVINGKVSYDQIPAFDEIVAASPWIDFRGAYRYPEDLDLIYAGAHFNWTIDMFWEGQNSTWALANRIYEGGRAGVVPIAQEAVETGRYYKRLCIGLLLDDLSPEAIYMRMSSIDATTFQHLHDECLRVSPEVWTMTEEGAHRLLEQIQAVADRSHHG